MTLQKLGLTTVADVLDYFPRRLEDRRHLPPIAMLRPGFQSSARGALGPISTQTMRGGKVLLKAVLEDESGELDLIWFNQPWVARDLAKVEGEIVVFGTVKEGRNRLEMASPEWEMIEDDEDAEGFTRLYPVYPLKDGVSQKLMRRAAHAAITYFSSMVEDPLPEAIKKRLRFVGLSQALKGMHLPENEQEQARARTRLVFDEFLVLQLELQMRRNGVQQEVGISFPVSQIARLDQVPTSLFSESAENLNEGIWEEVHRLLPFTLTGAQKRVIAEIWKDMEKPIPMNRLVQGDVGSGKTAVAACAMLAAVRCGYQAAMMAPTEILAEQHSLNLKKLFEPLGIPVVLMAGKLTASAKRKALQQAESGEARICVGTHALVQDGVKFAKLGLAVIDEQHRFGVMQRAALRAKGFGHPDVLVMTATPIPRTLTMAVYGDLDVSIIDELPPGRKPIRTYWKQPQQRPSVYQTVAEQVKKGAQAYFVCPMISESEKMQTQAAEDLYYRLSVQEFADLKVGLLHGQMKGVEKEEIMQKFRNKELDILVSTVVIEVGVDVPNATMMVIEDAYRFGLAQLHQLRGRVGRGGGQSYCLLISEAKTDDAEQRLRVMVETTDGFKIAEEDLKLRGPGELTGTKQSGQLTFKLADLIKDMDLLQQARDIAGEIIASDPDLSQPQHELLLKRLQAARSHEAMVSIS